MTDKKTDNGVNITVDEKIFRKLMVYVGLLLPLTIGLVTFTFFEFGQVAPSEIGQIGQFFGGWLTPIMLGFCIILLLSSIRFQINQLRLTRAELHSSAEAQKQSANAQAELLLHSKRSFELESNAKGLINLVEQADEFLNTKINLYVDIINFDNKLPHETRLFHMVDNWKKELEQDKEISIKCRNDRDKKYIAKYLHGIHHEIYVCQSLVKNEGWVYLSPYMNAITEQIESTVTLYKVGLVSHSEIWLIKQAVNSLHNKVSYINNEGVVLGDEIIAKMVKETFKEILMNIPTPERFRYNEIDESDEEDEGQKPDESDPALTIS